MFQRKLLTLLIKRLQEPRSFIQILSGPRQVGKTTLALQASTLLSIPHVYASADDPTLHDTIWLENQWLAARAQAKTSSQSILLIIDEVQKILRWSEICKRLWDEDSKNGLPVQVLLLGSAPLLLQQGLTESLAGRFERLMVTHWSYPEMQEAFHFTVEEYIYFGGYPGAAHLRQDHTRWQQYVKDSLIETTLSRDLLLLQPIHKPALLRRLFHLGCLYSGQMVSLQKILGQLQDRGNVTTLSHYLDLFTKIWMLQGLPKFAGEKVRQRASSPKWQVFNTALMTLQMSMDFITAQSIPDLWGRLVESSVGGYLSNQALLYPDMEIFYWRERGFEVDFVVCYKGMLIAIEVKSGPSAQTHEGLKQFAKKFSPKRSMIVGTEGIPLEVFLSTPLVNWFED